MPVLPCDLVCFAWQCGHVKSKARWEAMLVGCSSHCLHFMPHSCSSSDMKFMPSLLHFDSNQAWRPLTEHVPRHQHEYVDPTSMKERLKSYTIKNELQESVFICDIGGLSEGGQPVNQLPHLIWFTRHLQKTLHMKKITKLKYDHFPHCTGTWFLTAASFHSSQLDRKCFQLYFQLQAYLLDLHRPLIICNLVHILQTN